LLSVSYIKKENKFSIVLVTDPLNILIAFIFLLIKVTEKEIFSNNQNSQEFDEFLDFIGNRVTLNNFKR